MPQRRLLKWRVRYMKGLELSRAYFEEHGKPMLERDFHDVIDRIAVGLVGHGSECYGFDDEISRDHDFEPRFSIWLTEEDERRFGFKLFRAYRNLPKTYRGVSLQARSLQGDTARGVQTISSFYRYYTGCDGAPETLEAWVRIPSFYLAEVTNGEVFCDPLGQFSEIRQQITQEMPFDARKKRLASALFIMAQSGQYNVLRCIRHGEYGAASLALSRFAENALQVIYLLNFRYAPYYKWAFKGAKSLSVLKREGELLEKLLCEGVNVNAPQIIEEIVNGVIKALVDQGYASYCGDFLEPYAIGIQQSIADHTLRHMPIVIE